MILRNDQKKGQKSTLPEKKVKKVSKQEIAKKKYNTVKKLWCANTENTLVPWKQNILGSKSIIDHQFPLGSITTPMVKSIHDATDPLLNSDSKNRYPDLSEELNIAMAYRTNFWGQIYI